MAMNRLQSCRSQELAADWIRASTIRVKTGGSIPDPVPDKSPSGSASDSTLFKEFLMTMQAGRQYLSDGAAMAAFGSPGEGQQQGARSCR